MKKEKITEGKILPQLLVFAIPLVIGSLFQLTYNLFDFIVLGWFSADPIFNETVVSAANPIMSIFISLISGFCVGAGIHTSELFGQDDKEKLKRQITSFYFAGFIGSIVLTILFLALLNPIMIISNITEPVLKESVIKYLAIVSIGFIATFIYNNYASVLRSMGDSMASLLFLVLSCVLNIGLNIFFVVVIKLEIVGVAVSTTVSQFISAFAIMIYAKVKYKDTLRFQYKNFKFDKELLGISTKYATASALQQVVLYIGKYIISTQINTYSNTTISAYGLATKIDDFVFVPAQNFAHATAIFIATNKGAQNISRAKKVFFTGFGINLAYGIVISIVIAFAKEPLLNLFISTDDSIKESKDLVVNGGVEYLTIMSFIYILPCVTNSLQAYFRGIGKLNIVFYSTLVQITARVIAALLLIKFLGNPLSNAAYATGIGWIIMILFETPLLIYYFKTNKNLKITTNQ